MTFEERLRELREGSNLSIRKLARRLGKSHTHIRNLENGDNRPSSVIITKIADVFGNTQANKDQLEFELCSLAGILPDNLRESIRKSHDVYQPLEEKLRSIKRKTQTPRRLGAMASHMEGFKPELPNLPIIGREAGYTLLYLEAPAGITIRVSSETKPFAGLQMRIRREGRVMFEGVTDKRGDVDISDVDVKEGDIVELDAPLQFIVEESVLRSF
ncbi:helix-turn-helix domain-containing protein [Candidatus Poribacteria bacterium]